MSATLEPMDIQTSLFDGAVMKYRHATHDLEMMREIWKDRYYTEGGFDIPHGAVVLDLGGGVGGFTVFAAQQYAKKIYTFEPEPSSYDLLVTNTSRNPYAATVTAYQAAVTVDGGKTHLSGFGLMEDGVTVNTGTPRVGDEGIEVESYSIHDVLGWESHWDVLKVDIEGYEVTLLNAFSREEFDKISMITMEFHGGSEEDAQANGKAIKDYLAAHDFEVAMNWAWGNQGRIQAKRP